MTALPDGLSSWARKPGPALVLDAVRRRAQRGQRTEAGTVRVELSGEQRREVALLLGTRWEVSGRPPRLQDLAAGLAEHGLSALGLVEAIDGRPVEDVRSLRERLSAKALAEHDCAVAELSALGIPRSDLDIWLVDGGLPRPGGGDLLKLVRQVAGVWRALPGTRGTPVRLAQLAATVCYDAHGLDARQPLGRAVARLAAVLGGLPRPLRAGRAWRDAWASVGVRCDGVSPRVLVLNLPLSGDSPSARLCAVAAGEPIWLTMRSLSGNWGVPEPRTVFVCENPTVLEAAADLLGGNCPPMVCTDGFASGAALDLIGGLSDAGCRLRIRADVDPAGFSIVDQIRSVAPDASLWRFDVALYSDVTGAPASSGESRETGPTLRELSDEHGVALHEERVLDQLLADLADLATDAG